MELSQDDFARKVDVPYTTLIKIGTGIIKSPSFFTIAKIAIALDVSLDKLYKNL